MTLDIIVNVYNLEKTLESLYNKFEEELKNIKYNLIFIDNASTDKTLEILKNIQKNNDLNVKIVSFSKKFDKNSCFLAGIIHSKHDFVCLYDLDNNYQINQIAKMYDYLCNHKEYDQICMKTNYVETNFFRKMKLKLFNKMYDLNFDYNNSYFRIMNKNVVNAIIEYSKQKPFSIYTFNEIGFNTYYMKTENKKIDEINYKLLKEYSTSKNKIYNTITLSLLTLTFVYLLMIILELFVVNNNIILLFLILTNIFNLYLHSLFNKEKEKTYYLIKERIGFEENVL